MWRIEVYPDSAGNYRWRLFASNGRKVATSGESFATKSSAERAAGNFKANAKSWNYQVYEDTAGNYRWRAKSANGQTVASSGESFDSKFNAERAAENVRQNGGGAVGRRERRPWP